MECVACGSKDARVRSTAGPAFTEFDMIECPKCSTVMARKYWEQAMAIAANTIALRDELKGLHVEVRKLMG